MWPILSAFLDKLCSCFLESVGAFLARHAGYVHSLEDNLARLETTLNSLMASKEQVMQRVLLEEQQQKERLPPVALWFERVEKAVAEGNELIISSDQELQRLCLGGYCSTNCRSTATFGKTVDKFLNGVCDLLEKTKEFDQVTAETPATYVQKFEDNLADVKTTLDILTASKKQVMQRVLVEEQQQQKKRLDLVVLWFKRVDKVVAEGHELIKIGDQELQSVRLGGYFSIDCWSTSIFGKKVYKFLNQEVRDLLEKFKEFDQVTAETPMELVAEMPCDPTVGLETKLEEVWSCLANNSVVGMYGIGGVGKTTILTQIHNKFVDTYNDILMIWVVVGKDARPEKIQENIANKIGVPIDLRWGSGEVSKKIFNKLRSEKFVLFLDDIWKRVDLAKIGIPTQEKLEGSKIVFSTRSSKVCDEMRAQGRIRVEILEWENAWKLFRNHAGEDTINIDPEIPQLAISIAKKCGGLPIALKVIGRAMSGKVEPREWRHSIRMLKEPSQQLPGTEIVDDLLNDREVEVFEILKFSYDGLANDKWRSCFSYCALHADDQLIDKHGLVDKWICEDFWDNGLTMEARDEAYSIIDSLVRSCLLEDEGEVVKMHDVIRDMALWLEKDNFVVMAGMQLKKVSGVEKWKEVKRLSLIYNNIEELTQVPPCHKLVTLLLRHNEELHEVSEDFFQFMGALTVLDLSYTNLRKLPKSIEKLVSLQYLNIERTGVEELPVELAALDKLKSLNVSCLQLKAKRSERVISGMSSLQVLKMVSCSYSYQEEELTEEDNEEILLDELNRLEHLIELQLTIKSIHNLERLNVMSRKLLITITALRLEVLEGSRSLNIWLLKDMKYLSNIRIANSDSEEIHYAVMETRQATTVGSIHMTSFRYVNTASVMSCKYLKDLTIMLVLLPNLTRLYVGSCDSMEDIIDSSSVVKLGEAVDPKNHKLFFKLNDLVLQDLPKLRCIYQNPLPFPRLRHVNVYNCSLLKKLPLDSNSKDGTKIELTVNEEWWEAIEWKDDATKAVLLPRFKYNFF